MRTSLNEIEFSLRQLQLSKAKSSPGSWGLQVSSEAFGSPRGTAAGFRAGFGSLPTTPTATSAALGGGLGWFDGADAGYAGGKEPVERVESGRALRAKMFEKLSKECVLERADADAAPSMAAPDVGWVSELVK